MATSVGLNFRLTAAVDKFEASMKDVEKRLGGVEKATKSTANGMRLLAAIEVGKLLVGGLTKVFNVMKSGASTVISFSNEARAAADAIGKLSSSTGMAHEPLQILTRVADHSGVSADNFGKSVQKMSRSLGEAAEGSGAAYDALTSLGLSVQALLKMSPSEQFMAIGTAIGSLEDPTKKSAAAADIFGRSGVDLVTMFEDLEGNVRNTGIEMADLGQILSGTQVKNIEAMNDAFSDVWKTVQSLGQQILGNIAPILTAMVEDAKALVVAFEYNGNTGGQALANYLTDAFFAGAEVLAKWVDSARDTFADFFLNMMDFVGEFGKYVALFTNTKFDGSPMDNGDFKNPVAQALERAARDIDEQMSTWGDLFGMLDSDEYSALQKKRNDLLRQAEQAERDYLEARKKSVIGEGTALETVQAARQAYEKSVEDATAKQKGMVEKLADSAKKVPIASEALEKSLEGLNKATLPTSKTVEKLGVKAAQATVAETKRKVATDEATEAEKRRKQAVTGQLGLWDKTADRMMAFWKQLGVDPVWLEQRRQAERTAYEKNLKDFYDAKAKRDEEIERRIRDRENARKAREDKLYEDAYARAKERKTLQEQAKKDYEAITKFSQSLSDWWNGQNQDGPDMPEAEETLPELQTQTQKLDGILAAARDFGSNFIVGVIG